MALGVIQMIDPAVFCLFDLKSQSEEVAPCVYVCVCVGCLASALIAGGEVWGRESYLPKEVLFF